MADLHEKLGDLDPRLMEVAQQINQFQAAHGCGASIVVLGKDLWGKVHGKGYDTIMGVKVAKTNLEGKIVVL